MSRLDATGAALKRTLRRINVAGVARVVLVVGAGVGLVHYATDRPIGIDLVAATGEQQAPLVGTSLATRVAQTCPGPELNGIPGIDDVPVPASLTAAAGPAELLPVAARGSGRARRPPPARPPCSRSTPARAAPPGRSRVPRGATVSAGSDPVLLTGTGAMAPAVAASQEWWANSKDLRGLVTVPCGAGGSDLWLLAGGSGPGRQERLILTNPGANPVSTAGHRARHRGPAR